jgi:LmbE family N-acetylglucosaminyl deacetylase
VRARRPDVKGSLWGIPPEAFGRHAPPPTHVIDVRAVAGVKLAALACHRTQLPADHPLAHADAELVRECLGEEWFRHEPAGPAGSDLLPAMTGQPAAPPRPA